MTQHNPGGIYTLLMNFFISKLEQGIVPWHQPFTKQGIPVNLLTSLPYAGINTLYLASLGYEQNFFLTYAEALSLGAVIKEDEIGHPVILKEQLAFLEDIGPVKMVDQIIVFNIAQCEGIPPEMIPSLVPPINPLAMCHELVKNMPNKPTIRHQGDTAYYNPELDLLLMPLMKCFNGDIERYYATLIRELVHATGHKKRLNRKVTTPDLEELTAELGLWILASWNGIPIPNNNDNGYCERWISKLMENHRLLFDANLQAQYAIGYILDVEKELKMHFDIHIVIPTL